jgi:hypothetical protein
MQLRILEVRKIPATGEKQPYVRPAHSLGTTLTELSQLSTRPLISVLYAPELGAQFIWIRYFGWLP